MSASRKDTSPTSPDEIGSDLARVDAYANTAADYDDIPDMADRDPAEGLLQAAGVPRIGRPPLGAHAKKQVTLRLDREVLDRFRGRGAGWQGRINKVLRDRSAPFRKIREEELSAESVSLGLMRADDGTVMGRIAGLRVTASGLESFMADLPAGEAVAKAAALSGGVVHVIDPDALWDAAWGELNGV